MDFLTWCDEVARTVTDAVSPLVGTPEAGTKIRMGADGTPTQQIDMVAEECILGALERDPFCSTLVSEEAGRIEMEGDRGTIFLDPIDGSYNAVVGIPFFALSIAYAENGVVQEAFVRDLARNDTFTARKGEGAYLNGKPMTVSKTASLEQCALSLYGRKSYPGQVLSLGQRIRRLRLLGASALELCYTGCGRIDGFVDLRGTLRVTDAAAGMLVCTEGGGKVTDPEGKPLEFPDEVTIGKCIIATNGLMHRKIVEYLR